LLDHCEEQKLGLKCRGDLPSCTAQGELSKCTLGSHSDGGMPVPNSMGLAIGINFQPTGGSKAAITGDFVLIGKEVNLVMKALQQNGIAVTAVHSHMLEEQPRLFFMHFWANDDAVKLAKGLRAALDKTNSQKGSNRLLTAIQGIDCRFLREVPPFQLTQQAPRPGEPTQYETEVRVLMVNDAIYFGFICHDVAG